MLVPRFTVKRVQDGVFGWIGESEYRNGDHYRVFTAVGKTLADVKEFPEIVRWCERTNKIEDLGWQLVPLEEETGIQTTWGGDF